MHHLMTSAMPYMVSSILTLSAIGPSSACAHSIANPCCSSRGGLRQGLVAQWSGRSPWSWAEIACMLVANDGEALYTLPHDPDPVNNPVLLCRDSGVRGS